MAKGKVLMMLKEVIYMLYDEHGNKRVEYRGELAKRNLSEARIKLLENLCDLVLNTDIVHDWTKMYLKNRNYKAANVWEKLNDDIKERNERIIKKLGTSGDYHLEQEIDKMKVTNKIQYDQTRLEKELGSDIMTEIIYQDKDIGPHLMTVTALLCKYKNLPSVRDNIDLDIRKDIFNNKYNGNFIEDYGSTLYTYLKETKKIIEKQLNENRAFVGYFNYLCSESSVSDKSVAKDRELLHKLLTSDIVDLNVELNLLSKEDIENGQAIQEIEEHKEVKTDNITQLENAEQIEQVEQVENNTEQVNTELGNNKEEPLEIDNYEVDIDISDVDNNGNLELDIDEIELEDETDYIYQDTKEIETSPENNSNDTKEESNVHSNINSSTTDKVNNSEVNNSVDTPKKNTIRMQF